MGANIKNPNSQANIAEKSSGDKKPLSNVNKRTLKANKKNESKIEKEAEDEPSDDEINTKSNRKLNLGKRSKREDDIVDEDKNDVID